jgi:hypothetical protein
LKKTQKKNKIKNRDAGAMMYSIFVVVSFNIKETESAAWSLKKETK